MKVRIISVLVAIPVLILLVSVLSLVPPLLDNPFLVARQAVVDAGEWSDEDVFFESGTYSFFFVQLRVHAKVAVATVEGERRAEIEMVHFPFVGWLVKGLRVHEAVPTRVSQRNRARWML